MPTTLSDVENYTLAYLRGSQLANRAAITFLLGIMVQDHNREVGTMFFDNVMGLIETIANEDTDFDKAVREGYQETLSHFQDIWKASSR